jgi:outer membrane biosynthesis protein TonB
MIEPDEEIRRTTLISGLIHGFIIAVALLNAPEPRGPKIPNVPERYARLLVEPPKTIVEKKPEPPKPPEPEPEPPKQAERPKPKPEKKIVKRIIQKKPRPVVLKPSPVLKQASNVPPNPKATSQSVSKNPAPVNVNTLGALSALTAVSNAAPSSQPVSININKNAGGPSKFTTTGVLGALKTSSGKLQAGGVQSVQTRGLGVGSGSGYGIQGMKGTAGSRGVAGGIIGSPQIMSVSAQEGLTRAQVMAVVKKHLGEIQQCYERSLFQAPTLAGKVEYEWDIQPTGTVSAVKVKSSQMTGADAMNSCVFAIFKKMKFPTAKNNQMTVPSIPLEFGKL